MSRPGLFITATGTGVGKTFVTRGMARALRRRGFSVAALKPLETGCEPEPLDALALDAACGRAFSHAPGLYRARPPLAPYAATLAGEPPPPSLHALAHSCHTLGGRSDILLVEGAGGILVPLDPHHDVADLVRTLALPPLLVAPDTLGVLSHVLTAHQAALARGIHFQACVLRTVPSLEADASPASNARILRERLPYPVLSFPQVPDDDEALADAAEHAGLLELPALS